MKELAGEAVAALLDGVGEALVIADSGGQILAVNRAMEDLLGDKRDQLIGHTLADLEGRGVWLPPPLRRCMASGQREALIQVVRGRRLALTAVPLPDGLVLATARDITELDRLQHQVERMEQERDRFHFELAGLRAGHAAREEIVASSRPMQKVLELARRVAQVDSTILLLGESGAGKGVLAATIHRSSQRSGAPFIKIDCAALPESLLESELFGYAPGSFTGARREGKPGIIEQANTGTLLLDEIGDLPLTLQVKLLQVIQDRRFTRVGSVTPIQVDVRIIAATHRNLEQMVSDGRFRQDLFYRLNVVPITIPPLRERREDVPSLVRHFMDHYCARYRVERVVTPETLERLMAYPWPGNVRELENLIERLIVTTEERDIRPEHLPAALEMSVSPIKIQRVVPLAEALEALELELVGAAYKEHGSSVKVSKVLGIHQTTAARKIREWKAQRGEAP
ncbi:MAG TPA: sigma 54-interacting transcriptional regulator [Symbiobacteriaceae bacterium]